MLSDLSPMPFGKFKGILMEKVPAWYLDRIIDQDWIHKWPEVRNYIESNRDVINNELKENRDWDDD